jgi:uncharacterized Fe-S radical SAM superfamily protein PflX
MRNQEVHLWTFDDSGKVVRMRHYVDTAKHMATAGLRSRSHRHNRGSCDRCCLRLRVNRAAAQSGPCRSAPVCAGLRRSAPICAKSAPR